METDELSSCPVCFEPYTDVGDGLPRILPCHCTLCHKCIGKLLKGNTVVCPQDRQAHAAVNGITSFPQNKYVLIYLKKKSKVKKEEKHECTEHKEDEKLFCRAVECLRPICETCRSDYHFGHSIIDLTDEIKEKQKTLLTKVDAQMKNIAACKEKFNDTKQELCKNYEKNMAKLSRKKNEQCEILDDKLAAIKRHVAFLKETKEASKSPMTYNLLTESINNFEDQTSALYDEVKSPIHCDFTEITVTESCLDISRELAGIFVKKVAYVTSLPQKDVKSVKALPNNTFTILSKTCITPETYRGVFAQQIKYWLGLLISGDSWRGELTQYDMRGKTTHNACDTVFAAAAGLRIGGRDTLAVFTGKQIEYRNINNVEESVHRATTLYDSSVPYMCPVDNTTLLVGSFDNYFILDHKYSPLQKRITPIYHPHGKQGVCAPKHGGKTLVIIAAGLDGIFAYCLQSGALLWDYCDTVCDNTDVMSATDVATDGNNKIFVCDDGNGCVHVFSPDGAYVGDLIRKEERGLGLPFKISWNERYKSLLVAHKKDEIVHISSVKISL